MKDPHKQTVQAEFTKQAPAFVESPIHRDRDLLAGLLDFARVAPAELALDAACGPGLVARALAERARAVVAIDLTAAMLAQARAHIDAERPPAPVALVRGDTESLPFATGAFDLTLSRFAIHHFEHPQRPLLEMARATRSGGRVAVLDLLTADDPEVAARHNELECWRDPSHARALTERELKALFEQAGLVLLDRREGELKIEFGEWTARTFQSAESNERVRQMLEDSMVVDRLGLKPWRDTRGRICFSYRTLYLLGQKP